jgi:alkanesulfonate monooxygenase SsuD/methylene tetrahydromethanopterin reductase-like flavin-dependent oxidoreductase (luciferase family)
MHLGIHLGLPAPGHEPLRDVVIRVAELADQAGFATLVVPDHFSLRVESAPWVRRNEHASVPAVTDFFEAWSVLAFVAARTTRIRLSTMVSGITLRPPAVLVKTADTLDALSNGRAYLGVGASPNFGADEHQRMGLPFPGARERIARCEEVLQMALQLWSGEDRPFEGAHYQLASTIGNPLFVQRPHPPILIAGHGHSMVRLMAGYADAISIGFGRGLEDLRERLGLLRQYCQDLNRPYERIWKTTLYMAPLLHGKRIDPAALAYMRALGELGIDEVMIRPPELSSTFESLASELIPLVEGIAVAGR